MATVKSKNSKLEQAISEKADAEFQIAVREWDDLPISKERIAKTDEIITGNYAPFKSFVGSINLGVEHYLLPLIQKIIQAESDLRINNRVPFTDERITVLRKKIRGLIKEKWRYIVLQGYEDATKHVIYHNSSGHLPEYKDLELQKERDKYLATEPQELFRMIDELLQKASADTKIRAQSKKETYMETPQEKRKKMVLKMLAGFVVLILVLVGFAILPPFGGVLWLLFLIIAYPLIIAFTTSEKSMSNANLVEMYKAGLSEVPVLGKFFEKFFKSR